MKASRIVVFFAAVVAMLGLTGLTSSLADVPEAPEITGVVQDWNAESRYMVVEGVRYEFSDDFVLLTESGQPMPADALDAGAKVRFWSDGRTVGAVIFLRDGAGQ